MWCPNRDKLRCPSSGAAFAGLRWHELFDRHTPDVFHPSLFSLCGLLEEIRSVGELWSRHAGWEKHLRMIRDELGARLKGKEFDLATPKQQQLLRAIGSEQDSHRAALANCRLLQLEGYPDSVENGLIQELSEIDWGLCSEEKSKVDDLLWSLGTTAYRKGGVFVSEEALGSVISQDPERMREWLLEQHPASLKDFTCVIGIEDCTEAEIGEIRRVCDSENVPAARKIHRASPHEPGLPASPGIQWLRSTESSRHPANAITQFKDRVRRNLHLMALYHQKPAPRIHARGWVLDGEMFVPVNSTESVLRNHHGRRRATELADRAAKYLAGNNESALFAALDLHNAALSMEDHRFRLVNLWSALECLTSVLEGDSIISRVIAMVPPMLAWRNIDKHVRYLAINLHLWIEENPELDSSILPFALGRKQNVPAEKLLTALASPKDSPAIRGLLEFTAEHPLLLYRIYTSWQRFHDPRALRISLERSRKRHECHLYRIYRARNLLVHDGTAVDCLPQLADHLQHYVSWLLSRTIQALGQGAKWTIRDAWQFWKSKADYVLEGLPRDKKYSLPSLTVGDVFSEPPWEPNYPIWRETEGA